MTVTRTLVAVNPQAPLNKVNYDFLERSNKINDTVDNLAIHFSLEGDYIHTTSAEFKIQEQIEDIRKKKFN
jgi:dynein intermediate chain 1